MQSQDDDGLDSMSRDGSQLENSQKQDGQFRFKGEWIMSRLIAGFGQPHRQSSYLEDSLPRSKQQSR